MFAEVVQTIPTIYLTPLTVTLVLSLFVPIVTGILTKYTLHAGVKAIIMIILDTVMTLIVHAEMLPSGVAVISSQAISAAIVATVVSIATYLGVYVPTKLTNKPDGVLGAQLGIGPKVHQ